MNKAQEVLNMFNEVKAISKWNTDVFLGSRGKYMADDLVDELDTIVSKLKLKGNTYEILGDEEIEGLDIFSKELDAKMPALAKKYGLKKVK